MLKRAGRLTIALGLIAGLSTAWAASEVTAQVGRPTPAPNPLIDDSCGVETTLVLDASGSVQSAGAVDDVRDAADSFLEALRNTSSLARVTQFATVSQELAPYTIVDDASLATGGVHRVALDRYYNPRPPLAGVPAYQYRGGNPFLASSWRSGNSNQYTNWDGSLDQANDQPTELLVYVTDGDPTAYDFGDPRDPFSAPAVGYGTDSGNNAAALAETIDRAIVEANAAKATGTRVLAVGVGSALGSTASRNRLISIAGPQVVRDADLAAIDSLNDVDVALVTDFDDLAQFLRGVVLQLCSPSLTIRKLAQSADSAAYEPAPGWDFTVAPEALAPGTGFDWILPTTASGPSATVTTDVDGFANFQWEPIPPESDSRATVSEVLEPGFLAGRPDASDYRCEVRDEDGNVRVVEGDFAGTPQFVIDPIGQEIVTCTVWNSFDYEPELEITKVNDPPELRGDLEPPATVTSTFTVTNTGNAALDNVDVIDDRCQPDPVEVGGFNTGDADQDGLLDPGESWVLSCTRPISTAPSTNPAGRTIVNTAEVIATDPTGALVTAGPVTDDVVAFNPAIEVVKDVAVDDGSLDFADVVAGTPPLDVVYRYRVRATGNTPLDSVTLVDDTAPCSTATNVVRQPDAPGNDDARLDLGETWVYQCAVSFVPPASGAIVNTATATGVPVNPVTGTTSWYGRPNPVVRDTDTAEVDLATPGIAIEKSVDPSLVLLPATGGAATVTYTFEVRNATPPADEGLTNVTLDDPRCATPIVGPTGDVGDDGVLDLAEIWTYTCDGIITAPTVNVATATGQGVVSTTVVSDRDRAFVDVVRPGIAVDKTALRGVVLDPDAPAVLGPDVPTPRPAEYLYEVRNTGNVPLDLSVVPIVDDECAPLAFVGGDGNTNDLLDVGEVWEYSCSRVLERVPPPGPDDRLSGIVENTVTVTGVPFFDGGLVSDPALRVTDTDTASVLVIEPSIELRKSVSAPVVLANGEVTYTVEIENTGDVGLDVLLVIDDSCTDLEFVGGDTTGPPNGILDGANSAGAETWTYTCTRAIGLPEPPATSVVNTATVVATGPLGNVYEATDTAEVRVIDPAINLVKTVSDELVPAGTTVTYSFEVTNTGTSPLSSDDVLANILLVDAASPAQPSCTDPTFVGGDDGDDGLLPREPAEVWTYECDAAITTSTVNVAGVRGTAGTLLQPPLTVDVFDFDAAYVQVFTPAIEVIKTASATSVQPGDPVTYTYEVRNTGDVPLADVASRIVDDKCAPVTYVSGDLDGDGLLDTPTSIFEDASDEVWTFTCTTPINVTTQNTVVVTGTPTDPDGQELCVETPCDVTDSAQAVVTVITGGVRPPPASLTVRKVATPADGTRFPFTAVGESFTLADGESRTFAGLEPGDYTVTEQVPSGWTLDAISCVSTRSGDPVTTDLRAGSVTVTLAPAQSATCTFTNRVSSTGLPPTGASGVQQLLGLAWLVAVSGGALLLITRRSARRPA